MAVGVGGGGGFDGPIVGAVVTLGATDTRGRNVSLTAIGEAVPDGGADGSVAGVGGAGRRPHPARTTKARIAVRRAI